MKKWLFNPFVYVAGTRALIVGIAIMLLTAVMGYYSHAHLDGVLDTHVSYERSLLSIHLLECLIDWGCTVCFLFLGGVIFSRSAIRLIDVAGTLALARWPTLFMVITGFGIHPPKQILTIADAIKSITPATVALSLISLLFIIWMVALTYNAFSVSCNIKGGKAAGVFIVGLILAEILSKYIIINL